MTLVVGIVCKDGIVVAADSRTINEDWSMRDDTRKVHLVQLKKSRAIVARSGHDMLSARAVEILQEDARGAELTEPLTLAELAQGAMEKVRNQVRSQTLVGPDLLQKEFTDNSFGLMLAHYYKRKPYVFKLEFSLGRSSAIHSGVVTLGCAGPLADFLFKDMDVSTMLPEEAMVAAVAAIEEGKIDPRVGGPVRFGLTSWYQGKLATKCFDNPVPERTIAKVRAYIKAKKREWQAGLKEVISA